MAGGNFKLSSPKVRPGTYVNVVNGKQPTAASSPEGIAMLPLIGYDWGPRGEFIHLTNESPDAAKVQLGRSIYDDNNFMRMIALMFQNAQEVYLYLVGTGAKASATIALQGEGTNMTATAKYDGSLGNKLVVAIVANPTSGFDVSVILDGEEVELFEECTTVADLADSKYISFTGTGNLKAVASSTLTGGAETSGTINTAYATFLDKMEKIKFNYLAVPTDEASLITATITKIKYIRNSIGWKCGCVVANTAADQEAIYNLINGFSYDGVDVPAKEAVAWLAGARAGADYTTSLTYKQVTGATGVVGELNNEASILAIQQGKAFFTTDDSGNVILEYDRNSKVTFAQEDPVDIHKGRPCAVYDSFANDLLLTFIPGRYDVSPEGFAVMEGLGRAMLKAYQDDGAIMNVDLEADMIIDTERSTGDSVYATYGLQPIDSAEKYYFTVIAK